MEIVFIVAVFFFGSIIGSFLNVLIDRLPRGEDIFRSRSRCESCNRILKWYDLIPLFSYFLLDGRCRYCKKHIPLRILFVEILTGFLFLVSFLYFYIIYSTPLSISFFITLFVVSSFIVIFFTDFWHGIIPDEALIVLLTVSLISNLFLHRGDFFQYLLTGLVSFLFFLLIFVTTKGKGMGFGDVKFAFVIGFFLGFPGALFAFYAAFLTGAAVSFILIILRRKKLKGDTINFGPFLIIGIAIAVLFGDKIKQFLPFVF